MRETNPNLGVCGDTMRQKPLPPYDQDPAFHVPIIQRRVGQIIALGRTPLAEGIVATAPPPVRPKQAGLRTYAGFIIAGIIAALLFGALMITSDRIAHIASDNSKLSEPTTTGSAVKDPAHTQPAKPPMR